MKSNPFYKYCAELLHYRGRLTLALVLVLLNAAFAFAGFGLFLKSVQIVFTHEGSVRELAQQALADPEVTGWIGDQTALAQYVPEQKFHAFAAILGLICVMAFVGGVLRFAYDYLVIDVILRTIRRIQSRVFKRLIEARWSALGALGDADILNRLVFDSYVISRGYTAILSKSFRDAVLGVFFLAGAMWADPLLTVLFLLVVPVVFTLTRKFGKTVRRSSKYSMRANSIIIREVSESTEGMAVLRTHNAEGQARRRFNAALREHFRLVLTGRKARALTAPVVEFVTLVGAMGVSLAAAWYVFVQQQSDPAEAVIVLVWLALAGASFKPLSKLNNQLQEAGAACKRIDELLEMPLEADADDAKPLPPHQTDIRFEGVGFTYPNADQPALRDLTLTIPHAQTLAIVGANGSGKSTLVNLLTRITDPTQGQVLIDGHDLSQVTLRSLRRQIAHVSQQAVLFTGTVASNIALGELGVAHERIVEAAKAALAHDFVMELPKGYNTVIGDGAAGLSGGQRQRLCIARAALRRPQILILDEATSQVDTDSEQRINEAMRKVREGRTTLVIAHRLSTVLDCDRIIVLEEGRIVGDGDHATLAKACEPYRRLFDLDTKERHG
ncbi:MAG: ABC transporter ATP-binding protein [Phycisphaerales bacterium JB063]